MDVSAATTPSAIKPGAPPVAAPAQRRSPNDLQSQFGQTFSQLVAIFMRDTRFRNLPIAELEWLAIPPLISGQCRIAHSKPAATNLRAGKSDFIVPVAAALWARVSENIDRRLSEDLRAQPRLRPEEWTSGDIIWLIALAGEPSFLPSFLKQLKATEFKDKTIKLRSLDPKGDPAVRFLT